MAEKVLVLCQRRTEGINGRVLVNPQIEALLDTILGVGVEREIQYVSPNPGADIVGEFGNNDFTWANFKENDYAVIILNTCPFSLIDFGVVYKYLKPDGQMVLSNYLNAGYMTDSSITDSGTYKALMERSVFETNGFIYASHMRNAVVFNKVKKGGRIPKTKRKTRKTRKTRRSRKTIRSRRVGRKYK
jgi:hypothetical protein